MTFTTTKIWIFSLSSVPNTQKCKATGGLHTSFQQLQHNTKL